jgi:integrase
MKQKLKDSEEITDDLKGFLEYLHLKELSELSIKQYLIYYRLFPHDNITIEAIREFVVKHKGTPSRAFVRNYLDYKKIYDMKLPQVTGRKKRRLPTKLSPEDIVKLRYALYKVNKKYGIIFDLTNDGALRRAEVMNLTPQCFDWNTWSKDTTKPCRVRVIGKNNKERIVIISSKTAFRVKNYLKPYIKEAVVRMDTRMFNVGLRAWWGILKTVSEEVLGKRVKCHSLRHNRSLQLYEKGNMDILDLKVLLGHASISTTQLYLNPDEEKSLKKMEDFYNS